MGNALSKRAVRRLIVLAVVAAIAAFVGFSTSPAAADVVEIPVGDAIVAGEPGSVAAIGSAQVDADLVGRTCNVVAVVTNGGSVHTGNKLIVTSGGATVEIAGIEDAADTVTRQGGSLTLGATVDVGVMFGADGISSLGSSLTLTCESLPPAPPAPPVDGKPPYTG